MGVVAIIPLKALAQAKGRLADALDPALRSALVAWMFEQVATAAAAAEAVDRVLVVAGDEAAAQLARRHQADVCIEPGPGLDAALATADLRTAGEEATVVVAGDLPLVTAEDIDAVATAAPAPCVVVAPTRDGGTGALLRRPPGVIATAYGPDSARAHARLARQAQVPIVWVHREGLSLDVDTADHLRDAGLADRRVGAWLARLTSPPTQPD